MHKRNIQGDWDLSDTAVRTFKTSRYLTEMNAQASHRSAQAVSNVLPELYSSCRPERFALALIHSYLKGLQVENFVNR